MGLYARPPAGVAWTMDSAGGGDAAVDAHYGPAGFLERILAALRAAGKDPEALGPDDLAPFEELHTGGREATLALADLAGVGPEDRVLDVGAGVAGPARLLARRFGCRVTALDLTEEFCRTAEALTARSGLAGQVEVVCAGALALPFPDAAFDLAWTQHVAMNVADKARMYREMRRVLAPGGRVALFDVVAGSAGPPTYPLPWAAEPAISFLERPDTVRGLLADAGLAPRAWQDATEEGIAFFRRVLAELGAGGGPPPLGIHLMISDAPAKLGNLLRGLESERLGLLRAVCVPGG